MDKKPRSMHNTKRTTFTPITQKNYLYTETLKYSQDSSFMTVNSSKLLLHRLLKHAKGVNYQGADQSVEMYYIY